MRYSAKQKRIDSAANKVTQASVAAGHCQASVDEAQTKLYEAQKAHRDALREYRDVVSKFAREEGRIQGQSEGRRALLTEQKASDPKALQHGKRVKR